MGVDAHSPVLYENDTLVNFAILMKSEQSLSYQAAY